MDGAHELGRAPARGAAVAAALDVASVLLFVVIGRRSHDEGGSFLAETGEVAAPFLVALVVGWLAWRAWRSPAALRTGAGAWAGTVAGGMVLRPLLGRDVPVSFVVVTALVLAAFMLGWRLVASRVPRSGAYMSGRRAT